MMKNFILYSVIVSSLLSKALAYEFKSQELVFLTQVSLSEAQNRSDRLDKKASCFYQGIALEGIHYTSQLYAADGSFTKREKRKVNRYLSRITKRESKIEDYCSNRSSWFRLFEDDAYKNRFEKVDKNLSKLSQKVPARLALSNDNKVSFVARMLQLVETFPYRSVTQEGLLIRWKPEVCSIAGSLKFNYDLLVKNNANHFREFLSTGRLLYDFQNDICLGQRSTEHYRKLVELLRQDLKAKL